MADGGAARVPPQDLDAEAAVLSAILTEPAALDEVREIMTPADCYADANRRIFETAIALADSGQPVDAVTVAAALRTTGKLEQIGGTPYLGQLAGSTPSVANLEAYARIVTQCRRRRDMISLCRETVAEAFGDVGDFEDWAQAFEAKAFALAHGPAAREPAEPMAALVPKTLTRMRNRRESGQKQPGISTGYVDLTKAIGGWESRLVYIIAGRPGMGKSSLMLGSCVEAAKDALKDETREFVLFASAEMPKEQLAERALAAEANIPLGQIRSGHVGRDEWKSLALASETLRKIPLLIDYVPGATASVLRSSVRRAAAKTGGRPRLVAIDYVQLLRGERQKGDTRETEVAGLMRQLVWLASEFECPIIVGSQLNRGLEARSVRDKRPQLSDLRESGALEQDAYGVLMLYRDDYYNKDSKNPGVLEVIVSKLRNGATGSVELRFIGDTTGIANLARADIDDDFPGEPEPSDES